MKTYRIKSNRKQHINTLRSNKSETHTIQLDYRPWEDDNGTVSSVSWTVKSGQVTIANESLSSGIAEATILTSEIGSAMVKIEATAGNNILNHYLKIHTKDPNTVTNDYGILQYGL